MRRQTERPVHAEKKADISRKQKDAKQLITEASDRLAKATASNNNFMHSVM